MKLVFARGFAHSIQVAYVCSLLLGNRLPTGFGARGQNVTYNYFVQKRLLLTYNMFYLIFFTKKFFEWNTNFVLLTSPTRKVWNRNLCQLTTLTYS